MILRKRLLLLIGFIYIAASNVYSQNERPGIGRGSLESQFNYLIYQSEAQDNYRLVRSWWLYNIKNQVDDSLQLMHGNIDSLSQVIINLDSKIDTLNSSLASVKSDLSSVSEVKDQIEVFGLVLQKNIYNIIMWSLAGILTFALLIFIVMFKRSHVVTREAKNDLAEVKEEFEAFRKRALEREREVTRKLYDEVLKYKNKIGAE